MIEDVLMSNEKVAFDTPMSRFSVAELLRLENIGTLLVDRIPTTKM